MLMQNVIKKYYSEKGYEVKDDGHLYKYDGRDTFRVVIGKREVKRQVDIGHDWLTLKVFTTRKVYRSIPERYRKCYKYWNNA